jgi:hypothetical protein
MKAFAEHENSNNFCERTVEEFFPWQYLDPGINFTTLPLEFFPFSGEVPANKGIMVEYSSKGISIYPGKGGRGIPTWPKLKKTPDDG